MRLPSFDDLSMEQDTIYTLPLDGNHLVTGPPGTGKSVMALYRAQALDIDDRDPTLLMYSRVLMQYTAEAAKELGLSANVTTYNSWINAFWREHFRTSPPYLTTDRYAVDWPVAIAQFAKNAPQSDLLHDVLVDEGQDFSKEFYGVARWLAANITVFADENQQIKDEQCTIADIRRAIKADTVHALTRNYRNTHEIALVARQFYVGVATGMPDLPQRHGDRPSLARYSDIDGLVDVVARHARSHSDRTIGIACRRTADQMSLLSRLKAQRLPVPVETYASSKPQHRTIDFDSPGIKIINYQSIKGLEFDTLYVPSLERVAEDHTSASTRMMFYVITSRARRELHLSWCGGIDEPAIVADIPRDLLERM